MTLAEAIGCAALVASVLLSSAAGAAPQTGERVSIRGCPVPGVTGNCLMLKGADGTVYDITGVSPRPRLIGRMIWLRGTVSDRPSVCAQGQLLDRVRWTRVRELCRD
jgi:hypothetical protein